MDETRLAPIFRRETGQPSLENQEWREALRSMLGKADRNTFAEAEALLQERDPELFFQGLLVFAGRQQKMGNLKVAAAIYERVGANSSSPSIAERAKQGLAALSGTAAFGQRAEFLLSQFSHQASDYRMIVPMIAGSALFNLTRAATLGRLAASEAWFSRGLAARVAANLSSFAVEVPSFSLLSRGLMDLSGESMSWSPGAVAKDLASTTLMLGALKSFGYLGNQAYLKVHGLNEIGAAMRLKAFERFSQAMIPQASAFSGMLFAHHVETELGLRPKIEGASVVTDTLASLLSLGVGSHLGRRALGAGFQSWESELGIRTRYYSDFVNKSGIESTPWNLAFAPAPIAGGGSISPQADLRSQPMAMSTPEGKDAEPFYISTDRIRSGTEAWEAPSSRSTPASTATSIPFRTLVHRNNLFGGRVQALAFQSSGQKYTLGARAVPARNYKNLYDSPSGKPDSTLVGNRSGYLHLRQKVEDEAQRIPDYMNLFRNERIQAKQASVEERNGELFLRNLTREPLVWVMEGSKWRAVEPNKELPLKDGSWIVLGTDPSLLPENTLDPQGHSVLKVELHRPKPLGPDRWNLVEFESREPAQLEKIPTTEAYLAALLGQSSDFIAWRFRPLLKALGENGWKIPEAKDLVQRVFNESPILAELNIGLLAEVLNSAQRNGWSRAQLRELLFHEALLPKSGMGFLSRLPRLLEESGTLKVGPAELSGLLTRMANHEGQFLSSLEALPKFLREWQNMPGEKANWQQLFDFLDRSEASIEVLRDLFSKIPGGEGAFLETMTRLIPELQVQYGYRGVTFTELGADLLKRLVETSPEPMPPTREWVEAALSSLPNAFTQLFRHHFGFFEQREILFRVAEEQGPNFSKWWREVALKSPERGTFESYLKTEKSSALPIVGLVTIGLGLLGLHELGGDVAQAFSPGFMLGASLFFAGSKGNRSMSPTFALGERLRAVFSSGPEKVERLLILGQRMEREGYYREARERYESAVSIAMKSLDSLGIRDSDNRGWAGEMKRAAGNAFFDLAGFWFRRSAGQQWTIDFYRSALEHLEPLGQQSFMDVFRINNARARLQSLHLEEAKHWATMGDHHQSGVHYEGAGDFTTKLETKLALFGKAADAYAKAEPARLDDFSRVIRKIDELKAP